ncbi:hypothetical protein BDV40DRAFT_107003 [Aspergillus tamarii]|uniref:Uncharacterized protein n=1 Tax=Aspergillus tamarii TaxID=41984 RepID=A0A5N6V198_ASPTM|nr:hypothetical protein BDV40DRAFT_107003 [Aspergillus tamarii]
MTLHYYLSAFAFTLVESPMTIFQRSGLIYAHSVSAFVSSLFSSPSSSPFCFSHGRFHKILESGHVLLGSIFCSFHLMLASMYEWKKKPAKDKKKDYLCFIMGPYGVTKETNTLQRVLDPRSHYFRTVHGISSHEFLTFTCLYCWARWVSLQTGKGSQYLGW